MFNDPISIILTLVATAVGSTALSTLVTGLFTKGKTRADAAASLTTASISLVTSLQSRLDRLDTRVRELEMDRDTWKNTAKNYKDQLDLANARLALFGDNPGRTHGVQ